MANIADLKSQVSALESGRVSPLPHPSTELALRDVETQLRDERASAERIIADLQAQLDRERELRKKAEQDCQHFEKLIREMLSAARTAGAEGGDLPEDGDEPATQGGADAPAEGEEASVVQHSTPPYPAELTEWLRSRLDAKDIELAAQAAKIAELQATVDMTLDNYRLANQKYLEERDKALYWERRCAQLRAGEDGSQAALGEGQDRAARTPWNRRPAPQPWTGAEPPTLRDRFNSSTPGRAAGPP
jgi:hypothetical protein